MPNFLIALLIWASFTGGLARADDKASKARLDEVERRGMHVMPFNLEQTSHIFSKTRKGGLQQVVVKNPANAPQIRLIREHLAKISREFAQGDFSNPEKIHGKDMPGLAALRAAPSGSVRIVYRELSNGAQIDYASEDPHLVEAIHQWFDAQLRDHARHALPGHAQHRMHHGTD